MPMRPILPLVLVLGLLPPTAPAAPPGPTDPARLRELLQDRQHPRNQSQAALLLVQDPSPEARHIIRWGLRQTDSPEVFQALAAALRLARDGRFADELFAALAGGRPPFRQAAAEALAELADGRVILRLQNLIDDP